MVTRARTGRPAAGFGLVEVMVTLVVLAVGVLGAVASATLAARTLREAAARETAVRLAALVHDSLLQVPAPAPGERRFGRHRVRWTVGSAGAAKRISLVVDYRDGSARRLLRFEAVAATAPYRLRRDP